jgi:C2H2 transcription facotor
METSYANAPAQAMGQSHFFYYNPDPTADNRQHGHFSPHPHGHPVNVSYVHGVQAPMQTCPSTVVYARPSSADAQNAYAPRPGYGCQNMLTPIASPRPVYHKSAMLAHQESPYLVPLDTDCTDLRFAPSTPPLSSSGSAVSSPPSSYDLIPTPVNGGCIPQDDLDGFRKACEEDAFAEIFADGDWTRSASPIVKPCKFSTLLKSVYGFA